MLTVNMETKRDLKEIMEELMELCGALLERGIEESYSYLDMDDDEDEDVKIVKDMKKMLELCFECCGAYVHDMDQIKGDLALIKQAVYMIADQK